MRYYVVRNQVMAVSSLSREGVVTLETLAYCTVY